MLLLVDIGPGIAAGMTLRPGQITEVELHFQMARNNIQDNGADLLKPLRNSRYFWKMTRT